MSPNVYQAKLLVAPSKSAVGVVLSDPIVRCCKFAIDSRGAFSIALSGGSLPAFLQALSTSFERADVDPQWAKWHVLLADERCVVSTNAESNLGAIQSNFTAGVPIPEGQVYGIDEALLEGPTDAVAADYEQRVVKPLLEKCGGMLDCVVLGFGPDGHTCSLFPGHPLLKEDNLLVAPIDDSPKPPPSRITLTYPVLNKLSRQIIFCGAGSSKQPILRAVFRNAMQVEGDPVEKAANGAEAWKAAMVDPAPYPCGMARTESGGDSLVWVADADAAAPLTSCEVGLYGLAVMGQNFALNMASHGFKVCVGNRSPSKVELTVNRAKAEGMLPLVGSKDVEDFVMQLSKPRKVVILVMAGKPVDDTIAQLSKHMEAGDVIVDGGNEWFHNTLRRSRDLESKGIHFVGMGISGGEEGARNGPSLMPGGPREAYDLIEPIISKCAAQVNDGPCTGYVGPVGAGNYVKMIHNGIEYGDMQLIGEVYDVMRTVLGMSNDQMADAFAEWNKGELESYLIEITAKILRKRDDVTGRGHVVDYVLDKTGMKGTGRWTIQEAAERSVAAPTMAASLDARYISARKDERVKAAAILKGPGVTSAEIPVNREQALDDLRAALYAAKVCSYAQGLGIIRACSDDMGWSVDLGGCARLWKGGCIIRAALLQKIQDALARDPGLPNLLLDPAIAAELNERSDAWRRAVVVAVGYGVSVPSLAGSLGYFDSCRRASLPANLTQAQRDFFGGHTYERTDREGVFHTAWTDAHKSIGDITERKAGEI